MFLYIVEQLKSRNINAESLNSKINSKLKKSILSDLNSNKPKIKLLYITPELGIFFCKLFKLKNLIYATRTFNESLSRLFQGDYF